jgi:hypothetical protein
MNTGREQLKRNSPLWAGVLLIVLAILTFALFFVSVPGQQFLPWVNLLLSGLAVVFFIAGLRRASSQPERYRGKAAGWALTIVSSLVLLFAAFAFYVARKVPDAAAAPQVGQKAPDFELKDTKGQTVSLAQLLAQPHDAAGAGARPKAVLLVFYRGYW